MRKLITIHHVSLDGVIQAPGGPEEDPSGHFTQGGWSSTFADPVVRDALVELMAGDFDLLLGRRTYEIWAPYWPTADDHFIGKAFNKATKYVATRSLDKLDWKGSQRLSGDVVHEVKKLKAAPGPDLHLWGSSVLLQALVAAGLVDEFRLWVYPVVLGHGKRLFETGVPAQSLSLVDSRRGTMGVLYNTYRPTGPVPAG